MLDFKGLKITCLNIWFIAAHIILFDMHEYGFTPGTGFELMNCYHTLQYQLHGLTTDKPDIHNGHVPKDTTKFEAGITFSCFIVNICKINLTG